MKPNGMLYVISHSSSCLQVKAADNSIIQEQLNQKVQRLLSLLNCLSLLGL